MKTLKKTIKKSGDRTDLYIVGENLMFKWGVEWVIVSSKYDGEKDYTYIKLIKL